MSPRLLAILLCLTLTGCATTRQPRAPESPRAVENTPRAPHPLAASLDALLHTTDAKNALWGVFVQSLDSGDTIYDYQGRRLMLPASAMKLLTLAAAAERLGWDFRYETEVLSAAPLVDGVLQGDLIVRGSGDPSIHTDSETDTPVFDAWATTLQEQGIRRIDGRVIGDDNRVEDPAPGYGWSWDDLPYGYAALTGALVHQDNTVRLIVHSGSVAGEDTLVEVAPLASGVEIINRVETELAYTDAELTLHRQTDGTLEIRGGVPAGSSPVSRTAAVRNPTTFFVRSVKQSFEQRGIEVTGDAVDLDDVAGRLNEGSPRVLARHESPPLSSLATTLMQASHNLYAETLLNTLDQNRRPRTADSGRAAVRDLLAAWGIDASEAVVADGSGLSRHNLVTAHALVEVLRRMHEQPRHAVAFLETLPVAGVSGTLASRMVGTAAEGNVRAKTGSMANVRTLAGYVTSADGEPLAFAILANNFSGSPDPVLAVIDGLVDRLAQSDRSESGR